MLSGMLASYQKLKSETSAVRYLVTLLLGAAINFTIGIGVILSSLNALVYTPAQTLTSQSPIPQSVILLVTFYFIIGIIYATAASLSFQPKRIVSPLYVQIISAAFVPILIASLQLLKPVADWVTVSALALVYFLISFVMFFIAGVGQTAIVRYLVGLNGTKENTRSLGLTVDGKIDEVLKVLRTYDFEEALAVVEQRKIGRHFYLFAALPNAKERLFIVIIADPKDDQKTELATVSYTQTYYGIFKTGELMEVERKDTIIKALKMAGMKPLIDNTDSLARRIAYRYGLSVTESKLLSLKSMPPHSRAIGIGIALMALIMSFLWKGSYITSEMFVTFWIFAGFAILFDFLPLLTTKRRGWTKLRED
jgi:hypothetical protein